MPRTEDPVTFRDTLHGTARTWTWRPVLTITLAFWPCSTSYTQFEVKHCEAMRYRAHNVSLCTPMETRG